MFGKKKAERLRRKLFFKGGFAPFAGKACYPQDI